MNSEEFAHTHVKYATPIIRPIETFLVKIDKRSRCEDLSHSAKLTR